MELEAGFKLSEAGPIPEDWDAVPLNEALERTTLGGNYPNSPTVSLWPLIKMGNLERGQIRVDELEYVRSPVPPDASHRLKRGDVLLNTRNTLDLVGKVAIWNDQISEAYFNSNLLRLEFKTDLVSSQRFANFRLNHPSTLQAIRSLATGTTSVGAIYTRDLLGLVLALPSSNEQRAIGVALDDLNAWVAEAEAEAAKLASVKAAAMNALLTPTTRLPGLSGEWNRCRFGDLVQIRNRKVQTFGNTLARKCVDLENITSGSGSLTGFLDVTRSRSFRYSFESGDVLFGRLRAYLEKYWVANCTGVCSTEIWPLTPKSDDLARELLAWLVRTSQFIDAASVSFGTHMPRADWAYLSDLEIKVPSNLTEQKAIAAVLFDIDAALLAARGVVTKARGIKAAAMDALLSGCVRLPSFGPAQRRTIADAREAA